MSIASRIEEIETHIGDVYDTINYSYDTTGVNKNIINIPKYLKKGYIDIINNGTDTLYSNFPKVSGIGSNLSLTPTYEAPMKLNEIQGDTFQQTYEGNNLLNPIPNTLPNTLNGISVTRNTDGSLNINGTATSNWANITNKISTNLEPNTYKFLINSELTHTIVLRLTYSDETYNDLNIIAGNKKREITTTKTIVSYYVYLMLNAGTTYSEKVYLQLKLSSSSDDYEPYVGGTVSPNPNYPQTIQNVTGLQNIKLQNKNFYQKDGDGYLNNQSISTTTGNGYPDENSFITNYMYIKGFNKITLNGSSAPNGRIWGALYDKNKNFIEGISNTGQNPTLTISNDNAVYLRLGILNEYKETLQVEPGEEQTTYIAHQEQNFELNLGKNLFDKDNANIVEGYINAPSGSIIAYPGRGVVWIQCQPNTTYTISKISSARFAVSTYPVKPEIGVSSSINNAIRNDTATNITITSGANDNYLGVWLYNAEEDTLTRQQIIDTLQIEKGSQATSYSPYFTPIELNKIGTYQDYIYKSNGNWYLHQEIGKVVLNGSEDIGRSELQSNTYRFTIGINESNIMKVEGSTTTNPIMCNKLIATTRAGTFLQIQGICYGMESVTSYKDFIIYCDATKNMTPTEFANWLSNNNLEVLYVLATPTDTLITNTELIEDLETLYTAKSQEGTTNISITSEDLEMILNISALRGDVE